MKIHYIRDACYSGMCDAHTHGLEDYGHLELQIVIDEGPAFVGAVLNAVGDAIMKGDVLHEGDTIEGLIEGGGIIDIVEVRDCFGDRILRLLLPDMENLPAWETDKYPYNMQLEEPYKSEIES